MSFDYMNRKFRTESKEYEDLNRGLRGSDLFNAEETHVYDGER